MTKLTPNQFELMFGFRPKPSLTKKQKESAAQLNQLFDAMRDVFGIESREVFREWADQHHGQFIRNVLDCPEGVKRYCQEALLPNSRRRLRQELINHMKKPNGNG